MTIWASGKDQSFSSWGAKSPTLLTKYSDVLPALLLQRHIRLHCSCLLYMIKYPRQQGPARGMSGFSLKVATSVQGLNPTLTLVANSNHRFMPQPQWFEVRRTASAGFVRADSRSTNRQSVLS